MKGFDSSECFLSFTPKWSHSRAFYFYYMEPLHNQAEEPLLPEGADLYIGTNLKCPAVSPEIASDNHITLPRSLLIFMWQLFWFLAEIRALM